MKEQEKTNSDSKIYKQLKEISESFKAMKRQQSEDHVITQTIPRNREEEQENSINADSSNSSLEESQDDGLEEDNIISRDNNLSNEPTNQTTILHPLSFMGLINNNVDFDVAYFPNN